jgi:hypothetical protein
LFNAKKHKIFSKALEEEIKEALSFYPNLQDYGISFRFKIIETKSFMLAQPKKRTMLFPRKWRRYKIIISKNYFTKNKEFEDGRVPFDIVVGWIGHELGHVTDYVDRSSINMAAFGYKYYYKKAFVRIAEIAADTNAVHAGLIDYLVVSKRFGRNPDYFAQDYIDKLNDLYPSVEDVIEWDRLHKKHQDEMKNTDVDTGKQE